MLPRTVEAHRLGQLDVALEGGVVGGRHPRARPITLVEDHPQGIRPAVQQQAIAVGAKRSERGVAPRGVDASTLVVDQIDLGLQQGGLRGAPQELVAEVVDPGIRQRDAAVNLSRGGRVPIAREHDAAAVKLDVDADVARAAGTELQRQPDLPAVEVGRPANPGDVRFMDDLVPDGLPDSARPWIPDRVWMELPVLLAAGLGEI